MIDFRTAVIERSASVPVVVDFWAAWCAPCRMLGPILERMASEARGRWELVKLDTEAQPDVAEAYGIRSIPAVKLFRDGRVVAEFVGALPESQIRDWLETYLPHPRQERLDALLDRWRHEGVEVVREELAALVEESPDFLPARQRLAQAVVAEDPQHARRLVQVAAVDGGAEDIELSEDVTSLADLVELDADLPEALAPLLEGARTAFKRHDLDATLEHLVDAAMVDKHAHDELARRAAVALFRFLGQDHELTRKHQRRLAMALHS